MTPSVSFSAGAKTHSDADTSALASAERILSLTLVSLFVFLCALSFWNAGGLWRDEANSVSLANETSLAQIVRHLDSDSFPLLWLLLLRGWAKLGQTQNDLAVRSLGLLTALCVPVAVLYHARLSKISFPFWSFLLLGFNPVFIRCIGSTRAYGLGVILVLLASALLRQAGQNLTRRTALAAFFVSLLCVQCIYYNILFVGTMCLGGLLIAYRYRDIQRIGFFATTFIISALSLLPYLPTIARQHAWSRLVTHPVGFRDLGDVVMQALSAGGSFLVPVWGALLVFAVLGAFRGRATPRLTDRDMYALTVLLISVFGYWAFLKVLQYQTSAWYYVELMALAAVQVDCLLSATPGRAGRTVRILTIAAALIPTFNIARASLQLRQTGMDLAAAQVQADAHPGDLILVNPWYYGTTFNRYYHGSVAWDTVPPFSSHRYGGMDQMQQRMTEPNPVAPTLRQIRQTLQHGGCVWLIGDMPYVVGGRPVVVLPPAPNAPSGWACNPYRDTWGRQVQEELQHSAVTLRVHDVSASQPISALEHPQIEECRGWRSVPGL